MQDRSLTRHIVETATPKKLGKYEIVGTLGKGAMGIVYDAFDPVIERRVAIKTISKDAMDVSEADELLGRFKREASAAGRLNHPGVVSIYDYGEEGNVAFIAMEYIKGKELKHYFDASERFEMKHFVRIMCEILDALDHAHRNRVYHRDIKPANIMITEEGRVKVADFGVARIESSMMTQVGTRIGTPAYMSPEQHQALPVDGRSDVFSCGVILYQFLTGERPFTGGGYTIVQQILKQDPIPPSEINFTLPRAFDVVVAKALAKKPDDRYKTAKDFIDALKRAAGEDQTGGAVEVDFEFEDGPEEAEAKPARPEPPPRDKPASGATGGTGTGNAEVALEQEFWNEIKDSTHKLDFEQFLESFPVGRLAPVARMRLRKLEAQQPVERTVIRPEAPTDGTVVRTGPSKITIRPMGPAQRPSGTDTAAEEARRTEEEQKRKQAEAERAAADQARLKQEQEQRAAEEQKRLAEESARRAATEQEKREAEARRRQEAADKAKREAEERKRQEADARAKREAEDNARKEAEEEEKRQTREKARLEAEAKAAKESEEKARKEAEAKTRREAEEQRQRELEERERKAAEAKAQREAEAKAREDARAKDLIAFLSV